jgi:hypothetical protein
VATQPDSNSDRIVGDRIGATADGAADPQPHLVYDDLRQWLDEARRLGEVKQVSGLSWQEDIGMVSGVAMHDDGAPCFVFDDVPGTIAGSRVLVNFFGGKRKNMTLGFPTGLSKLELSEGFRTNFMGPMTRIPPKYVNDGPIFENVMTGDDIDVTRFPAPKWHAGDGGRYIGTGSFNVTRDPDEGWINCGTYRVMIHDAKTAGFYISPGKHGRIIRDVLTPLSKEFPTPKGEIGFIDGRVHSFRHYFCSVCSNSGTPEQVKGIHVSADFFPVFDAVPLLGRVFSREEDRPGGQQLAGQHHDREQDATERAQAARADQVGENYRCLAVPGCHIPSRPL